MDRANEGERAALLINDSLRREKAATTTPKAKGDFLIRRACRQKADKCRQGGEGLENLEPGLALRGRCLIPEIARYGVPVHFSVPVF